MASDYELQVKLQDLKGKKYYIEVRHEKRFIGGVISRWHWLAKYKAIRIVYRNGKCGNFELGEVKE